MRLVNRTRSVAAVGIEGQIVEIEADQLSQIPEIVLIGLADTAVSEARSRIRSAINNSGATVPRAKIVLNLSPADLPKHGTNYDLALAVAVVLTTDVIPRHRILRQEIAETIFLGELGLDGRLRPVTGLLPLLMAAKLAGVARVFFPEANSAEANLVTGLDLRPVRSLNQVLRQLKATIPELQHDPVVLENLSLTAPSDTSDESDEPDDLSDVIGNQHALQAAMIAAAGGHNMLMIGPPGSGKSMIAKRFTELLPALNSDASLQVNSIRSIAGLPILPEQKIRPPFQSPHHTTTAASLIGGGTGHIKPGIVTLAHHGVLFLDEATLFNATVLDALRQPLEDGTVHIVRPRQRVTFPASFQLLLAANPCPCGKYDGRSTACICPVYQRRRYLSRLSGPLLDRVDIQIQTSPVSRAELLRHSSEIPETTAEARQRIFEARSRAADRWRGTGWSKNSDISGPWLRNHSKLSPTVTEPLDAALERGAITMRGYDRMLRVSWTVADLAGKRSPDRNDLSEALMLRTSRF